MTYGILLIEDEATLAKNIKVYLEDFDYEVQVVETGEQGLTALDTFKPDIILLDYQLPGINGLEFLINLRSIECVAKVIMITAHGNTQIAVDAMKAGAVDYLTKPLSLSELKLLLDKTVSIERIEKALTYYCDKHSDAKGLSRLVGDSVAMRKLKNRIQDLLEAERHLSEHVSPTVLVTGETGAGKELVAQAIHYDGLRRDKPFIEVNCASIPSHLLESELFGFERGAFTDAKQRKLGLVEAADGGTLFLDEVGDLGIEAQAKLLKLLEDKVVRRLGGVRDHKVNVRIIAATNRPLQSLVQQQLFRSDLYFRLKVIQLEIPPLRERDEDVLLLAGHFLDVNKKRYGKLKLSFSLEAEDVLQNYSWPGNVREMSNMIEQAVLLCREDVITPDQLALSAELHMPGEDVRDLSSSVDISMLPNDKIDLDEIERSVIFQALENNNWNISKTARLLGISRDTLRYRIEKHKLK